MTYVRAIFYTTLCMNEIDAEILRKTVSCGTYFLLSAYV